MKGLVRSLARGKPQNQAVIKQRVRLDALAVVIAGATGVGFGTAVAADLPEGNILFMGAASYLQITKASGASGITATFDGDYSVGTTATADATLSGTDANIIGSAALGAATAGVSPVARGTGSTGVLLDNTDGSLELNLNVLIDDAAISADSQTVYVSGVIDLVYAVLLDD